MAIYGLIVTYVTFTLALETQKPLFAIPSENGPSEANARASAPAVFNALHSSMRQWGSSLNHNGMSFFPATIPAGTDLYHGTHQSTPVSGPEWLAFEIEHAELFARTRGPGGPGHGGKPGGPGGRPPVGSGERGGRPDFEARNGARGRADNKGALHQYRTAHDLPVLFLDGMSAGKTNMGTQDQQDYILCPGTEEHMLKQDDDLATSRPPSGPRGDFAKALQMCSDFKDSISGIIRMEAGFELILCDFSDVEFISSTQRPDMDSLESLPTPLAQFEYLRGVTQRYHGITAGRVQVHYSHMVSAFFYNVNLTNPDPTHADLPRLQSSDPDTLLLIKSEVASILATKFSRPSIDWQGVVDLIVTRYSERLQYLTLNTTSHSNLVSEIGFLLNMHIDYSASPPDIETAAAKCSEHYMTRLVLRTQSDELIGSSVATVTQKICSTLFDVRALLLGDDSSLNEAEEDEAARVMINDLIKWLQWTTWLECGKCSFDEICFVAIWPYGGVREHTSPGCVRADEVGNRWGYWGKLGPGRPGGGKPGDDRPGGEKPGDQTWRREIRR